MSAANPFSETFRSETKAANRKVLQQVRPVVFEAERQQRVRYFASQMTKTEMEDFVGLLGIQDWS